MSDIENRRALRAVIATGLPLETILASLRHLNKDELTAVIKYARGERASYAIWTTRDGRSLVIREMDSHHLYNTIRYRKGSRSTGMEHIFKQRGYTLGVEVPEFEKMNKEWEDANRTQ